MKLERVFCCDYYDYALTEYDDAIQTKAWVTDGPTGQGHERSTRTERRQAQTAVYMLLQCQTERRGRNGFVEVSVAGSASGIVT